MINYSKRPRWEDDVLQLTDGAGVDLAVDVTGPSTLNKTLRATRYDGRLSLMGVLTGFDGPVDTGVILEKRITLQGIYVGSVATHRALIKAEVKPQIDRVFPFEDADKAYDALQEARHFGKLVIQIGQ